MHIPVLLDEVLEGLALETADVVLDCTIGGGGHSEAICRKLGKQGKLIGIDADAETLGSVAERLKDSGCTVLLAEENFRNLDTVLAKLQIPFVTKILFDLGMSSRELDDSGRGFSFRNNEPLIMTFAAHKKEGTLTAADIVNEWSEETLTTIVKGYGEERFASRIAHGIIVWRTESPLATTGDLVAVIEAAVPGWYRHRRTHYAAKTFQALRVAVNDELEALKEGLQKSFEHLEHNGRIAVISFHSLEDRIVKRFFKERRDAHEAHIITKRPLTPRKKEQQENPRSRSAKLRILQKI